MKPTEEKIQSNTSDLPVYLFKQGNNCEAYRYFGAHLETRVGESGVVFRVWAPHAAAISVVGDFNSWKPGSHPMRKVDGDSVWELFIPGMKEYDVYKYCVTTRAGRPCLQGRSLRFPRRDPAVQRQQGLRPVRLCMARCRMADRAEKGGRDQRPDEYLRDARRKLEAEGGRQALQLF